MRPDRRPDGIPIRPLRMTKSTTATSLTRARRGEERHRHARVAADTSPLRNRDEVESPTRAEALSCHFLRITWESPVKARKIRIPVPVIMSRAANILGICRV